MTLIGPGTWEAARAALDAAVTAADWCSRATRRLRLHAPARPPRHAHLLRRLVLPEQHGRGGRPAARRAAGPVAVIDVDAHHGNGTQAIFWDDPERAHRVGARGPRRGLVPALPRASRTSAAPTASNRNAVSRPARGDEPWVAAVTGLAGWAREAGAEALVVALGVDAAEGDPESPLAVTPAGFRAAGHVLGGSAFRPWWCRRVATTWTRSASWCSRR